MGDECVLCEASVPRYAVVIADTLTPGGDPVLQRLCESCWSNLQRVVEAARSA